ncbi:phosphoribosyltransferase [Aphanothece sacrum]|uniref:Phosphoribosyltransferase n=1 Tax=Aphanothece sacrum FPU1 TaxID=1920663 RepID=A0A401IF74_APHSA|nr:phosphoribosyltransferase family protein [Aphanothece sacrum]GBF79874.1 phosphoribosyltransferase [Aphanothece sacrum FPU1]GBF83906.1 phosphoribosyltransferase [Aphanothece sacrum FPU3]
MSDLYISWEQYHQHIETLAVQIYRSQWQFNQIVCIAKGGLRIGDILSRLYHQPLAIITAASYGGKDNKIQGEIKINEHLSMIGSKLGSHVLLVDDLVDSGISIQQISQWLYSNYGADIQEIRTAVLWYKSCSVVKPDYYVEYLSDNPWIYQPFEKYEQINIEELSNLTKF